MKFKRKFNEQNGTEQKSAVTLEDLKVDADDLEMVTGGVYQVQKFENNLKNVSLGQNSGTPPALTVKEPEIAASGELTFYNYNSSSNNNIGGDIVINNNLGGDIVINK